jgi:hypothetical protein
MQYRRIRTGSPTGLGPTALVGLGLGLAVGFVFGELFGGQSGRQTASRLIRRLRRADGTRPNPSELTEHVQAALARVLGPDAATLDLVPVGRSALELHGWVTSRPSRTRAAQAVRDALPPDIALVDRLLVWGEDDAPPQAAPLREEPEPA